MAIQMTGKLLAWIIMIPAVIIAYFMGSMIAEENLKPILIAFGIVVLFIIYFGFGEKIWIIMPLAMALPFTANFLPLNFSYGELATGLALVKFVVQYQALEKRRIYFGPRSIWMPFFIIAGILALHMVISGGGFRVMGSEGFGGRKYLPAFFAVTAFLLILNAPGKTWRLLTWLPFLYFCASIIAIIPSGITFLFPWTTPYIFTMFGTANISAYFRSQDIGVLNVAQTDRIGELSGLGIALILVLVSYVPIKTWWQPPRWWALALAGIAAVCVVWGGYRNSIFIFAIITIVAALIQLGFLRSLLLAVPAALLLGAVIVGNNELYHLPFTVQRTLSFIWGNWDPEVLDAAAASDGFRQEVREIYMDRFFRWTLIGNGFNFDPADADASMNGPDRPTTETFIIKKDFHVGWISLYDAVGLVGFVAMIFLVFALFRMDYRLSKSKQLTHAPIYNWLSCYMISQILGFIFVFGSLPTLMNQLGIFSSLLILVNQLKDVPDLTREKAVKDEMVIRLILKVMLIAALFLLCACYALLRIIRGG